MEVNRSNAVVVVAVAVLVLEVEVVVVVVVLVVVLVVGGHASSSGMQSDGPLQARPSPPVGVMTL